MVLTYKELIDLFGNDYQIKKHIAEGDVYKICDGYYTPGDFSPIELLVKKFPNSVFSFTTALFFHGLIREIPNPYYLTSKKDSTRIKDDNVIQLFSSQKSLFDNVSLIFYDGIQLMVYSKEKTLVSLVKNRNKISPALYHEAVVSYRKISTSLNMHTLNTLINKEKNKTKIREIISREIL